MLQKGIIAMKKLYEKKEILFAVLWIVAYCVVMSTLKEKFGYDHIYVVLALSIFSLGIIIFVRKNKLEGKYGLRKFPSNMKKYLFFIPMLLLATGNVWDGFSLSYKGTGLVIATLSMILVGFVEEMIFRGFLFKAMLAKGTAIVAIIVSALTFGIGHIVNLLAGQASFETVLQIIFAISWGFIFTMAYYKSGSLIPCIIAHAMIDALSLYGADSKFGDGFYIGATIVTAIIYCIYLGRLQSTKNE